MKLQWEIVLEFLVDDQLQLHETGFRIAGAAAELCGKKVRASYGLFVVNEDQWRTALSEAACSLFGLDAGLTVLKVATGSGVASAALLSGDKILAIGGQDFPRVEQSIKKFRQRLNRGQRRPNFLAGRR
jgi:hypothetical protein